MLQLLPTRQLSKIGKLQVMACERGDCRMWWSGPFHWCDPITMMAHDLRAQFDDIVVAFTLYHVLMQGRCSFHGDICCPGLWC
jgi:hypothetical protein